MVDIPEHLLKRSQERRSALGLGGGEATPEGAAGDTPAAKPAAPAAAAPVPKAPPPAPKAPEPPKPDPIYIQAAKQRKRLPWWSIPVFAALPIWGVLFVTTLSPVDADQDPFLVGSDLYSSCAGCHGSDGGGGGTFPALTDVGETFPDFRDHLMWVRLGTQGAGAWPADTYGPDQHAITGNMPGFATWSDAEIAQVVLFERQSFGGVEIDDAQVILPDSDEPILLPDGTPLTEEHLLLIAQGELHFDDVGLGIESQEVDVPEDDLADRGGSGGGSSH